MFDLDPDPVLILIRFFYFEPGSGLFFLNRIRFYLDQELFYLDPDPGLFLDPDPVFYLDPDPIFFYLDPDPVFFIGSVSARIRNPAEAH